jgi:ABC-type uncharacterized transport system fused permease/ATPase subunit
MRVPTTSSKSKAYRAYGNEIAASATNGKESTRQGVSLIDTARRQIMRDAWRLAEPYWTSEEKWSARGLLLAVIALDFGKIYISLRINAWNNAFYALQAFNSGELFRQLGTFCVLVAFAIAMSVYALYLNQMLQVRWRRWLTRRYLGAWLADHAYYQLQLRDTADNPDQRIAEDLRVHCCERWPESGRSAAAKSR